MSQTPYTDTLRRALQTYIVRAGRQDAAETRTRESADALKVVISEGQLDSSARPALAKGDPSLNPPDALKAMEDAAEAARLAVARADEAVKQWKSQQHYGSNRMASLGCITVLGALAVLVAVFNLFNGGDLGYPALFGLIMLIGGALSMVYIGSKRAKPGNLATLVQDAHVAIQRAHLLGDAARQQTLGLLAQSLPPHPSDLPGLPWTAPPWQQWQPRPPGGPLGGEFRLGRLNVAPGQQPPFLVPMLGSRGLFIAAAGDGRNQAAAAVQSLVLRLLAVTPPSQMRLTFIDPIGRGNNVAGFMHLKDHMPDLISGQAWAESRHIEQALADLTGQMDNLIQQYLRNKFPTLADYNAQAAVPEPYRILAVFDFPANFSETAARYLVSLAENGPRCGIFPIILCDPSKPLPYGFEVADLVMPTTFILQDEGQFTLTTDDALTHFPIILDQPPPESIVNRVVGEVGARAKKASIVEVKFSQVTPPRDAWWRGSTRDVLSVPLGPAGATRQQHLTVGKGTAQHALLAGRTGSGKSNLLHVLIAGATLAYPPTELELYLIDFKEGVEFKPYATNFLPHARVVAIESEREFGLSVLEGLDRELDRRGKLFRDRGVQNLSDFRAAAPNEPLPRILLVVDEFQVFFAEDDTLAARCGALLDKLVRQGRSFGIHLLLGSQTLAGAYALNRSTMEQMGVRIALQCSEADSRVILAEDNPAARLLTRPGEAIYNAKNGIIEANENFQAAFLPQDELGRVLGEVRQLARQAQYRRSHPLRVFEGRAPAQINKNMQLSALLNAPAWPAPDRKALAWLGEPVAIADPTAAVFRRQTASNLLIVSRDEELAAGMVASAVAGLATQMGRAAARFYLIDFSAVDGPSADVLAALPGRLPHGAAHIRRNKLADTLGEIHHAVKQRLDCDEATVARRASLFVVVHGLHRARDLRADDADGYGGGFNFGDPQPAAPSLPQMFADIIREGPEVGVHVIAWADSVPNLSRVLDRRLWREFDMRVAMQMNADDSSALLDNDPRASQLRDFRAYFYSSEDNRLEKFSPYGPPPAAWLDSIGATLAARA